MTATSTASWADRQRFVAEVKAPEPDWEALRQPEGTYPPWVSSAGERRRWDLACAIAAQMFPDEGDPSCAWLAARSLYRSDIPT